MPSGPPSGRGLSLDPSIPGYQTFTKPLDDTQTHPRNDESIHRIRTPYDRAKDQSKADQTDHSQSTPSSMGVGEWDQDHPSKTKYPYRDDKQNAHNASAMRVVARWLSLGTRTKTARRWEGILNGLNPKFQDRSRRVKVILRRADTKNLRWIFEAVGSHSYIVKMKVLRKGNVLNILKTDLELSCSCPAWQWQGPEYHAKQESYQLGELMGTATSPDIRDPGGQNRVCKHVAAVLSFVKGWKLPPSKGKSPARVK